MCTKAHAKRLVELLHDTDATVELLHLRNSWVGYAVADWLGGALIACMLLGGWATAVSEAIFSSCLLLPVLLACSPDVPARRAGLAAMDSGRLPPRIQPRPPPRRSE